MARKAFALRIDERVMAAVERAAAADVRSVNSMVEVLVREALRKRGIALGEPPAKES